ncbi:hypothetical protein EZV62_002133 [Acer yangbiense]|uniref:FAR1 domain-containing protein n=1 Tax=Acer yangbiense TaxID=1000413 RepID=A0A5C7IXB2_9ROSI|nr:hypothetical protein EZV62_002133 [Acer yangbiense]
MLFSDDLIKSTLSSQSPTKPASSCHCKSPETAFVVDQTSFHVLGFDFGGFLVHNYSGCLSDSSSKPRCGMEFDNEKIAYDFYNTYGRKVGFRIRRESYGKNNKTGELTSRTFVCSKHGIRSNDKRDVLTKKPRAQTRTGCDAQMSIKLNRQTNNFCVTHFVEVHNHPLIQEECTHMLPSQRKMVVSQAIEVNLAEESGITLKSSYELMERQAMSGKAPKTIFTDQDAAMAKTLSVSVLSRFMNYIEEENEFLAEWNCMLDEYGVHDNSWLKSIFELRKKWAYVYVKQAWSTGMKSTQLSESFNGSLKDYLKSDHNLPQFFMHFEKMVNDKRYKELEAEYDSCYRLVNLKIPVKMLIQARDIYTKPIFEEFQEQFVEAVELNITNCIEDNGDFMYTLTMYDAFGKDDNCKKQYMRKVSEHASNLARLVEDILHLEINGNEHVKDQESEDTNTVMECSQNDSLMKAKCLKKKETCRGRRRFKSSLEIVLAKKKKSSNSLQHCISFKLGFPFQGYEMSNVMSETP